MSNVVVTGAAETAAYLHAAVDRAARVAAATANYAAQDIVDDWSRAIPRGETGMSSAEKNNVAKNHKGAQSVGATAQSNHFVVGFLQFGTSKMSPRVDLFGIAAPHIENWVVRLADEIVR